MNLKGTVHTIIYSFTHPPVPNLYEFLSSPGHKGRYFEKCR